MSYFGRPRHERRLLVKALGSLLRARLEVRLRAAAAVRAALEATPAQRRHDDARTIAWAVEAVARRIPGTRCLARSLAGHRLLLRGGHDARLHIGARHGDEGFGAHAWVEVDGVPLVGDLEDLDSFSRLD